MKFPCKECPSLAICANIRQFYGKRLMISPLLKRCKTVKKFVYYGDDFRYKNALVVEQYFRSFTEKPNGPTL